MARKRQSKAQAAAARTWAAAARRSAETRAVWERAKADNWSRESYLAWKRGQEQARGRKLSGRELASAMRDHERDVAALARYMRSATVRRARAPQAPDPVGQLAPYGVHVGEVDDAAGAGASMRTLESATEAAAAAVHRLGRASGGVVLVRVSGTTAAGHEINGQHDADVSDRHGTVGAIMRAIYRAVRGSSAGRAGGVGLSRGKGHAKRGGPAPDYVQRLAVDVVPLVSA